MTTTGAPTIRINHCNKPPQPSPGCQERDNYSPCRNPRKRHAQRTVFSAATSGAQQAAQAESRMLHTQRAMKDDATNSNSNEQVRQRNQGRGAGSQGVCQKPQAAGYGGHRTSRRVPRQGMSLLNSGRRQTRRPNHATETASRNFTGFVYFFPSHFL